MMTGVGGQLTSDQQAHSDTVGSGTPKVQYTYVDGSGANNSRQVSMTDPGGRVITDGYGTAGGLNDTISRLSAVLDGSTTLESYKYLGQNKGDVSIFIDERTLSH
jgi:hypothetical protein